ncbi:MAG TPA: hypothetical protein VFT38_20860, partial [Vicinamibacteria bacterium]|nr:hypothetical protein [Vicinamibacteria bacterium]
MHTRRAFLERAGRAALAWPAASLAASWARPALAAGPPLVAPSPATLPTLAQRFSDLRRHFIFDFYPWYGGPPDYLHWDYLDRR